jgi:hypothetical protein
MDESMDDLKQHTFLLLFTLKHKIKIVSCKLLAHQIIQVL